MTTTEDPQMVADASSAASAKPAHKTIPVKEPRGLANGLTGTLLTWGAALLFYLVIILLPLVGQAAKVVSHFTLNTLTFAVVVVLGLVCSGLALFSRLQRRKTIDAAFPYMQSLLVAVYVFILLSLVLGLLKV